MSVITLRNLDPDLLLELKRRAAEEGSSLNKVVQNLLHGALGLRGHSNRFHDLDHHFGVWNREEVEAFEEAVEDHGRIDPELWK